MEASHSIAEATTGCVGGSQIETFKFTRAPSAQTSRMLAAVQNKRTAKTGIIADLTAPERRGPAGILFMGVPPSRSHVFKQRKPGTGPRTTHFRLRRRLDCKSKQFPGKASCGSEERGA